MQRTPAMAEGLTDHVWSIKELMAFRIPIQCFEYTTELLSSVNSERRHRVLRAKVGLIGSKNIYKIMQVTCISLKVI